MATSQSAQYSLRRTLRGLEDSVNCLQFSPDGQWLAAGGDDGRLAIYDYQHQDIADIEFIASVPVTSLLWHPSHQFSIFVGYSNGDLYLYHIRKSVSS